MKPDIKLGYYRHFKGKVYQVFGVGEDCESGVWMVAYGEEREARLLRDSSRQTSQLDYVQSAKRFTDFVEVKGIKWERFKYLGEVKP